MSPDHRPTRGDHDVEDALVRGQSLGDGRAGHPDPRSQFEDVDGAEHFTQHAGHAIGGVDARGGQLQERRLARAVGADDDPALALLDRPGDVAKQSVAATGHANSGKFHDIAHDAQA